MNTSSKDKMYSWQNCPESLRSKVNDILTFYRQVLGEDLVGFYLHGSLAMGCFNPGSSDIDYLAVVRRKLNMAEKKAIIDYLLGISDIRSEMSIVTIDSIKNMEHPTPFELHYNYDHREQYENGTVDLTVKQYDEDLVMHYLAVRRRGICLFGKPIEEILPEIPREMCIASIARELDWINEKFDTLPATYIVLNPCRAIAFLREDILMSKKEGGEWALTNLPDKFSAIINQALTDYTSSKDSNRARYAILRDFVKYAKKEIVQFSTR